MVVFGRHMRSVRCVPFLSRSRAVVLPVIALLALSAPASAQYAYTVPNGDFEQAGNASAATSWTAVTGSFLTSVNLGQCGAGPTKTGCMYNGDGDAHSQTITLTTDPNDLVDAVVRLPFCVGSIATDDTYTVTIEEIDAQGAIFDTHSRSGAVPSPQECDSLQIVPVEGTLTAQTAALRVRLTATSYTSFDNVGPISITPDANNTGGGDTITPEQQAEIDEVVNQIANAAADIYNFACGGDVPFVPTGGIGSAIGALSPLHGILASNLTQELQALGDFQQQLRDYCLQDNQVAAQQLISDSVTVPIATAALNMPTGMADPMAPSLTENTDAVLNNYVQGNDTLVSAQNRANRLMVADIQFQARAWDRALGGPQPDYATDGGPRISIDDITANEPNMEFGEGDYSQTDNRLGALAAGLNPDYEERLGLASDMPAATGEGACVAPEVETLPETATRNEIAMATLRWNASNTLAGSAFGEFICSMIERPTRAVIDICFFEDGLTVGGATFVQQDGLCIYGSNSMPALNTVFNFFPLGLLFLALLGGFKMFFH